MVLSKKERFEVNVYEAVGLTWIIFTSLLSTVGIIYFAYVGVEISIKKHRTGSSANEIPDEVRKNFKIVGADRMAELPTTANQHT
jgi:hypothetical protein